jgi:hypothetical protein
MKENKKYRAQVEARLTKFGESLSEIINEMEKKNITSRISKLLLSARNIERLKISSRN